MKRRDLVRHLERHGCLLAREGHIHSIFENPQTACVRLCRATARFPIRSAVRSVVNWGFPILGVDTSFDESSERQRPTDRRTAEDYGESVSQPKPRVAAPSGNPGSFAKRARQP